MGSDGGTPEAMNSSQIDSDDGTEHQQQHVRGGSPSLSSVGSLTNDSGGVKSSKKKKQHSNNNNNNSGLLTEASQQQLLSALASHGMTEIYIEVNESVLLIPEMCNDKNSRLLVAQMESFCIANELPISMKRPNTHKKRQQSLTEMIAISLDNKKDKEKEKQKEKENQKEGQKNEENKKVLLWLKLKCEIRVFLSDFG